MSELDHGVIYAPQLIVSFIHVTGLVCLPSLLFLLQIHAKRIHNLKLYVLRKVMDSNKPENLSKKRKVIRR